MTIYYVRTNGNDSTGDGSTGTPWLTIKKAVATVTNGDTILVGDGTYAENDGGTLLLKRIFTSYVTIQPELGAAGAVTITTTSGTIGTYVSASAAYYRFKWITFTTIAGAANAFRINQAADHLDFQNCIFTPVDGATATLFINNASTWNVSNISFTNCTFNKPSTGATHAGFGFYFSSTGASSAVTVTSCTIAGIKYGCDIQGADGITFDTCTITSVTNNGVSFAASPDGLQFLNCSVTGGLSAYVCNGATNLVISGGTATNNGAANCVQFGADAASGGVATTVNIGGGIVITKPTGSIGHAVLFGNGCANCIANGVVVPVSYDYAVALKEHTGTEIKNCYLIAGTGANGAAVYCKAAVSANVHNNILRASRGYCFQLLKGDTNNKCQNVTSQYNKMFAKDTAKLINWGDSTNDLGGGIEDYNVYSSGPSRFGIMRADTDVLTLAELQAAWTGYDVANNDTHSTLYRNKPLVRFNLVKHSVVNDITIKSKLIK